MSDDYSDHPISIGEIRASKSSNAADWSAREMLVSALRDIDRGEYVADQAVLIVTSRDPDNITRFHRYYAVRSTLDAIGIISSLEFETHKDHG